MKSSDRILAQRYAAAYDELSSSDQEARRRCEALEAAQKALFVASDYMQSPQITVAQKEQLVKEALQGEVETAHFVALLLQSKRYALLGEIVSQVQALLDKRLGIVRATVFCAAELSAALKADTKKALQARYGGEAQISYQTDASLLGGLKIWCCGELIDGSLKGRFIKLQEELTK